MNPKVSVFIATSLDGYIARANGDIDWLDVANSSAPKGEDCGYADFMQSVDALVMGRNSYEKVQSFDTWPYAGTPVTVMSRNPIAFPTHIAGNVSHSSEPPEDLHARMSREGVNHIYIDGGNTIQRFLSAGLVDEITVTIIPVVLGDGIPLFGPVDCDVSLTCIDATSYAFGFVQLKYAVTK